MKLGQNSTLFGINWVLSTLLTVFTLSSCTEKPTTNSLHPLLQDSQNIISTRPQNQTHIMAIVKLKIPALLETSTTEDNTTIVSMTQLGQIQAEQELALAEMKKLSSDVQVIYKYKYVINAICVLAPVAVLEKLKSVGTVASWESVGTFSRPAAIKKISESVSVGTKSLTERNSSKFIGAEKLNLMGLTGQGIKVGVLDTGIDFTHAMFKGVGTAEAFKAIDPSKEALGFPNEKIIGGIDLVGTHYDAASPDFSYRIPKPDLNPIDEGGHGTHVAGTISGLGDSKNSYNGVAPDADLYAIKVFGANGSTSDMVVIAGLEYAADPNGDGDLNDQLDVVNLSLGGGYGNPKLLYSEAIKNLTRGGTIAVISAGNSGARDYIVGAPGTSTEALSVAASVDNGDHNWQFLASQIFAGDQEIIVEAIEAVTTVPVAVTDVAGDIAYIGLAAEDLTEEQIQSVKGKVALIDRGIVAFNDKIKRAQGAGAIGVIIANNQAGPAFPMGTQDAFSIPAIMVTQQIGASLKSALQNNQTARINYKTEKTLEKPELIDTLTDFSSKGPRSVDGFLKPEISAPGSDIISADMGQGTGVVKLSGTSMAAPHVAGVAALVKQSFLKRELNVSALDIKHVMMGTSKTIGDQSGRYPVTRQGAGRVQADLAAQSMIVALEPSISFGEINVEAKKTVRASLNLKNLSDADQTVALEFLGNEFITFKTSAQNIVLKANDVTQIDVQFVLDATLMKDAYVREMDGWIFVKSNNAEIYRIPVLAVAHKLSAIQPQSLEVLSTKNDSENSVVQLNLKNESINAGELMLFNYLGSDQRKPLGPSYMNADCDLQSIGYRIVQKPTESGIESFVEFGVKIYKPMTTWQSCDVSLLIDSDKDNKYEQEILGSLSSSIPTAPSAQMQGVYTTTVIDFVKAQQLRKAYEAKVDAVKNDPAAVAALKGQEQYDEAILERNDMLVFNNSTVVVLMAPVKLLKLDVRNKLNFKVVVTHNEQASVEMDDYFNHVKQSEKMFSISLDEADQGFSGLADSVIVNGLSKLSLALTKGRGTQSLLMLAPQNKMSFSDVFTDEQAIVVKPVYKGKAL